MPVSHSATATPELDRGALLEVIEATPTPLWVIAPDRTVQFANPAALATLGYTRLDEVIGAPSHATLHDHRPDGTAYPSEACPILDQPGLRPSAVPEWFMTRGGRPIPVTWSTRALGSSGAKLLSFSNASGVLGIAESFEARSRQALRQAAVEKMGVRFRDPEFSGSVLAAELHVSVRTLQTLLAEDGLSPAAEIRRLRLAHACLLLARGASVTNACHESGFSDVGTFARAFRRQFGEPPSAWARRAG